MNWGRCTSYGQIEKDGPKSIFWRLETCQVRLTITAVYYVNHPRCQSMPELRMEEDTLAAELGMDSDEELDTGRRTVDAFLKVSLF